MSETMSPELLCDPEIGDLAACWADGDRLDLWEGISARRPAVYFDAETVYGPSDYERLGMDFALQLAAYGSLMCVCDRDKSGQWHATIRLRAVERSVCWEQLGDWVAPEFLSALNEVVLQVTGGRFVSLPDTGQEAFVVHVPA